MTEIRDISLNGGKKVYFASDFHLGSPNYEESLKREKKVVAWLEEIKRDAAELFLIGDVFDFWFEYKQVIPKGYTRLLGKLAELSDAGIRIHLFTGNHDMWIFDYLPKEIGLDLYRDPVVVKINGKQFFIGHGDGLGPGDRGYKFIKRVFSNKFCQWLFRWIHPDFGIRMAMFWSRMSRNAVEESEREFLGEEKEWLMIYSRDVLKDRDVDYFIFGHRHIPVDVPIGNSSRYLNIGDWINHYSFVSFDGEELRLKKYEG